METNHQIIVFQNHNPTTVPTVKNGLLFALNNNIIDLFVSLLCIKLIASTRWVRAYYGFGL